MFTDLKIPAARRRLTASEARISAIVGIAFALMILVAIFEEYSASRLSVVFLIVFWIPMLVVHELGHALMAGLLGWRVHEIVIGFGRTIWQGQVRGTRIRIKLAPVEGYVLPSPAGPEHVRLKSMLVYAAGPGAELLLLAGMLLVFGRDGVFGASDQVAGIALQSLAIVILLGAGFNLLPFRTEGAVSDGLGILSSPFMSKESIELRLLTFELREVRRMLETRQTGPALELAGRLLQQYPENRALQYMFASALSKDGQHDAARERVRRHLSDESLPLRQRRDWLHLQALLELDAPGPDFLTLDSALQEAFKLAPGAADLTATKGASLVLRGRHEEGGELLAKAWRGNDGSADDAMMLAFLTIAAHRSREAEAARHFRQSFEQVNRSAALAARVQEMTGRHGGNRG